MTVLYLVWELATGLNISDKQFNGFPTEYCNQSCPCNCAISSRGSSAVQFLLFIVLAAFTAIRVYALRKSLTLCLSESILFGLTGENMFPFGCVGFDNVSIDLSQKFVIISRSCLIVADCLAVGATWFALGLRFPTRRGDGFKGSITSVLLIDGTAFFLILAVLNSLHLTLTLISIAVEALQPISVVTIFTNPLSAILVSRFLLHLQSASLRAVGSLPPSQVSSLHLDHSLVFERVIGSLGASIAAEDYFMEDDLDNGDNGERADEPDLSQSSSE